MNTIQIRQGDVKSAILAVSNLLVADHKYSKTKAAEKATDIVKKAKAKNENFDGAYITKFTEDELKASVNKTASKKEPKEKAGLTAAQIKTANNDKITLNERARTLLTETNFTQITAIANALKVSFQRVTNVRKNMQKGKTDKTDKPVKAISTKPAASAKIVTGKTVPIETKKTTAPKDAEPRQKRKYTKKVK